MQSKNRPNPELNELGHPKERVVFQEVKPGVGPDILVNLPSPPPSNRRRSEDETGVRSMESIIAEKINRGEQVAPALLKLAQEQGLIIPAFSEAPVKQTTWKTKLAIVASTASLVAIAGTAAVLGLKERAKAAPENNKISTTNQVSLTETAAPIVTAVATSIPATIATATATAVESALPPEIPSAMTDASAEPSADLATPTATIAPTYKPPVTFGTAKPSTSSKKPTVRDGIMREVPF